jgi:intein/homing endonuclease
MTVVNRYVEYENGDFAVDLFPYKIKNRDNFIFRDHPVNLNPNSFRFKQYWEDFLKLCLEGKWVNDEGTWVFMMPKLFFYINYVVLSDEERNRINPRLRDNEWIAFTYFLCSEGFSGFEGDDKYTCNKYVGKLQRGELLQKFEQKALDEDKFVKTESGEYKQYVDPWVYLTETYLITDKRDKPLGQPIYSNGYYNVMMLCARAVGKALKPDEPVLTENGWVKMEDLRVGDKVYGSDGKLCNIVNKTELQKDLEMYKITLRDGRVIEACKDHMWKVWSKNVNRHSNENVYSVLTTEDMYKSYYTNRIDSKYKKISGIERIVKEFNYAIPLNKSIAYDEVELPIDPYFLGLWLGDGSSHRTDITTNDQEIVDYVYKIAKNFNHKVTLNYNSNRTTPSYHITSGRGNSSTKDRSLINLFKKFNLLNNKHIPEIYLRSSESQRLELLRGLMDSDGTASGKDVSFCNTNKLLVDNVSELARSLGMYVRVKSRQTKLNGIAHKLSYLVVIKTNKKIFNLSRKDNAHKKSQPKGKFGTGRFEKTYIVNIEKSGISNGYCIAVDNEDKTYITKDHIVTHNSFFTFMGYFFHEWLFGGVKRFEDRSAINNDVLFTLTSPDTKALTRSVSNLQRAYYQMPGQFEFPSNKKNKSVKYYGPFYKNIRGTWQVGASASTVEHVVKKKDNTNAITGSLSQITLMKPTDFKILTGDRFRPAIIEEVGFVKNLKR